MSPGSGGGGGGQEVKPEVAKARAAWLERKDAKVSWWPVGLVPAFNFVVLVPGRRRPHGWGTQGC